MAAPLSPVHLQAADRQRLERLLTRGWALSLGEHPLGRLQGHRLGPYRLLFLLGPKNAVGARYFQLFLADGQGRLSHEPLALGLHNSGPFPGYNWIELVRYQGLLPFQGLPVHLAVQGLDRRLLRLLSSLVPPGGHLMVEYESSSQRDTRTMLGLGYPPAVTPLGSLLLQAGCRSFRDWYIPEGGREGPRKLQGFKPLNENTALAQVQALHRELKEFLARPTSHRDGPWERLARRLAQGALRSLRAEPGTLP